MQKWCKQAVPVPIHPGPRSPRDASHGALLQRMRWLLAVLAGAGPAAARGDFAVAAYLPEWRYEGANWDKICEHVTHLILFSCEMAPNGQITALDRH